MVDHTLEGVLKIPKKFKKLYPYFFLSFFLRVAIEAE